MSRHVKIFKTNWQFERHRYFIVLDKHLSYHDIFKNI